ncbi:MAG: transposase [Alteromonadaceae bacterium]|jgi:transposase
MKPQRNGTKMRLRTGVYTSELIATMADERKIVLFETDIGHAGAFIDSVLSNRNPSMVKPIIMSDALSSNTPTQTPSVNSLCNAHGRREYVDVISHFPEQVEWVLELYGEMWGNRHLKHKTVEENSGLGKAIRYFDKHYEALTSFCWVEGAKRDNNEMEAQLKLKIRDRKNANVLQNITRCQYCRYCDIGDRDGDKGQRECF